MGYFSNGTEAMTFESKWCERCCNYRGEEGAKGCAVMDAHLLYAYELCNEEDHPGKKILDMLIPMDEKGLFCDKCAMFLSME